MRKITDGGYDRFSDGYSLFSYSTISPYLPKHIYPSVPSRVHLTATDEDATKNETENDDSLWDIGPAASTSALPPMNLDGLPTSAIPEPSNAQEGEGDMSLDDRPSGLGEQSLNGASSVRFSVGLAGTLVTGERQGQAINQQKTVTLGRFQTLRLGISIPASELPVDLADTSRGLGRFHPSA